MNLLKATLKAVTRAIGPFGAPLEFVITDIESEESNYKQKQILDKIESGEEVTLQVLEELVTFKNEYAETKEQFLCAFHVLINNSIQNGWNNKFINGLDSIGYDVLNTMDANNVISNRLLVKELSELYELNKQMFLVTIRDAGFNASEINDGDALKVVISNFLKRVSGYDDEAKLKIFGALYESNQGNVIIGKTCKLLLEKYKSIQ
jgi:hypothetical protein